MLAFENQNIEFKQEYVPDIRKEVMRFANAEGGTVYVGVRKDGAVPDGVMLQIVNSLKDSLAPDIMPFVRVKACLFQPEFETAKGVFRVTLPNKNEEQNNEVQVPDNAGGIFL